MAEQRRQPAAEPTSYRFDLPHGEWVVLLTQRTNDRGRVLYYAFTQAAVRQTRSCFVVCHNGLRHNDLDGMVVEAVVEDDVRGKVVTIYRIADTQKVAAPYLATALWPAEPPS